MDLSFMIKEINFKALKFSLLVFLCNKMLITLFAYLAISHSFHFISIYSYIKYLIFDNFYRWDSRWYEEIALHGYNIRSAAFFPLYPFLIHLCVTIFPIRLKVASICIANGCFYFALYFSYLLIHIDYDASNTKRVIWLMALYPTSFYYSSGYTESLYLLLFAIGLYFIRKEDWASAGITGFFTGLTRNTGVFLSIPFVFECFHIDSWSSLVSFLKKDYKKSNAHIMNHSFWFCLIPLSIVSFMIYLKVELGDAMAFTHAEKYFGRSFLDPIITVKNGFAFIPDEILQKPFNWIWLYYLLEGFFVGLVLFALLYGVKRLRLSYWMLLLALFLIPLAEPAQGKTIDYFVSFSRYSLVMLPLFIALYEFLKNHKVMYYCTIVFFVFLLQMLVSTWSKG